MLELGILPAQERHHLLEELNATRTEYPEDATLVSLIEAQVKAHPEQTAVSYAGQRLSYRELNQKANQLAHHLIGLGVKPDSLVAICCERSLEMIVGLLGILKAGGAYVPIDPAYPQERIDYMLADAQASIVLTQQSLKSSLKTPAQIIALDEDWPTIEQQKTRNPSHKESGLQPHCLLYTSPSPRD